MRKHAHHGWQWTPAYDPRSGADRYTLPRRGDWDLRCEDSLCQDFGGRMSRRRKLERGRWREGGPRR